MIIEAVTFDFWETLFRDTPENLERNRALRVDGVRRILARAGRGWDPAAVERAHDGVGERLRTLWVTGADAGTGVQVRWLLEGLDPALPAALDSALWPELETVYADPPLGSPPTPRAGAHDVLWALRERGMRIGLISNTGRTPGRVLRILLQRAGLLDHFEALTFSDEAGVRKPDARVFRWTLNKLGAPPERAVHVGDDLTTDVWGAQAAGLRAIHVMNGTPSPAPDPSGGHAHVAPDAAVRGFEGLLAALDCLGLPARG